jgi:photosystem II stability/assembly factor-like uncharacterized protein
MTRMLGLLLFSALFVACPKPTQTKSKAPNDWVVEVTTQAPKFEPPKVLPADASWQKLSTVAYKGKQDDIFFINPRRGWYGNGAGKIYRTDDGGATWKEVLSQPGTYIRALGFADEQHGFAGNIGTDYFPGVTDTNPLYVTKDGGDTWAPAKLPATPVVKGICAIDVLHSKYINAGRLEEKTIVHAAGRVGGPAFMLRSVDGGETWKALDLNTQAAMILDIKFFDEMNGLVFAASDVDVEKANALILRTEDGGTTWKVAYQSTRPFELAWKASFPTREVGYATIMSYDQDPTHAKRYVAKTTDGGKTWQELFLVEDPKALEFGIGFVSPEIGWLGTGPSGYQTIDGGATWTQVKLGQAANKIRIIPEGKGFVGYSIGVEVYKLMVP